MYISKHITYIFTYTYILYSVCVHIYSTRASAYRMLEVEIRACDTLFHNGHLNRNMHSVAKRKSNTYLQVKGAGYTPVS